jgi:membrane-bound lytic murein transglycosylase B
MLSLLSFSSYADSSFTKRKDVQAFINTMVKNHHFNKNQLTETMSQVQLQPRIIDSMERPYEKKTWDIYKEIFLTTQRLKGGLEFWAANQKVLDKASQRFGVPPEIIVAILGVETIYGKSPGEYRVLDALSTLAFNYPKRSRFFLKELKEYLLLCREHHVPATYYIGSYAGAIGKPQFMPSSYRRFAVDFAHKGHSDLVNNNDDAIASIGNYLHQNGWKPNEGIIQAAQLLGNQLKSAHTNPRRANYNYAELTKLGIKPVTAAYNHPVRTGVIELITKQGNEYWIAYPNFFVITTYNVNPQYALAVYLLSQQIKQKRTELTSKVHRAYA